MVIVEVLRRIVVRMGCRSHVGWVRVDLRMLMRMRQRGSWVCCGGRHPRDGRDRGHWTIAASLWASIM
jgi:hypothetical protein